MNAPLRAVIADDSALFRAVLRRAFVNLGGVEIVAQVANGEEAVEQIRKLGPDLLTLDLNMPEMGGRDALKGILAIDPSAKVIIVTAMNQKLLRGDLLSAGAKEVLGKPIRLEQLLGAVRDVLEGGSGGQKEIN